jgi:SAM-dependent methyltransferase
MVAAEAARVIDTAGIGIAADIGGAAGALLHALLRANPGLAGIVLDRPNVVPDAVALAERAGLGRRVRAVGGDFFEAVPAADLYLLKFILHDWNDDACIRILRSIARAIRPGGRVVVIEMLLGAVGEPDTRAPLMDLDMMVLAPGRERTLGEFQHLFAAAGLGFTRVIPANGPMSFIEAVKA